MYLFQCAIYLFLSGYLAKSKLESKVWTMKHQFLGLHIIVRTKYMKISSTIEVYWNSVLIVSVKWISQKKKNKMDLNAILITM